MQRFNTYPTAPAPSGGSDWQAEINGGGQTETRSAGDARSWQSPEGSEYVTLPGGQIVPMGNLPGMRLDLAEETIQNPLSVEEAHKGSIKGMLARNEGSYVVATFLVGTQGTVSWEGILYDVGNDFITIYQPGREPFAYGDIGVLLGNAVRRGRRPPPAKSEAPRGRSRNAAPARDEDPGLMLISRRPPQQKFTNFEEYMTAHGGATAPIEDHTDET